MPLRSTTVGVLDTLLVIEMVPDALAAVVGENPTVAVAFPPTASVTGKEIPVRLNS